MFESINLLLVYYGKSETLQQAFPEVQEGNLKNLLTWAAHASQNLYDDPGAFDFLANHAEFYYQANKFDNFLPHPVWNSLPDLIFVFGAGRSGTTLMKRILNCHSMVTCLEEGNSYDCIVYPPVLKCQKIFESNKKLLGLKAIGVSECLLNNDLNSFPLESHQNISDHMRKLYNNQPIIFMIRDVRDRVSSMYNLLHKSSPNIKTTIKQYESWINDNLFIQNNFSSEIQKIKKFKNKLIGLLTLEWLVKNTTYLKYKERGLPVIGIKYEDLVTEPSNTIRMITDFLGIPFEESMLDVANKPHPDLKSPGMEWNFDNVKRKPDSNSLGLYKKYFNKKQEEEIMSISSNMMRELNYI